MASHTDQAAAIRDAVSSVLTCSPATTVALRSLLLPDEDSASHSRQPTNPRGSKTARSTKPASARAATKEDSQNSRTGNKDKTGIPPKAKAVLATEVINASLKSLGEAAKQSPQRLQNRQTGGCSDGPVKSAAKAALRRSNSAPTTPLQPVSLNRTSSSPMTAKVPSALVPSTGCLSTIECARVAFLALRSLQTGGKIALSDFQLETGMSSFISRLIALEMWEQASKEVKTLRKYFGLPTGDEGKKPAAKTSSAENRTASQALADMLDFRNATVTEMNIGIITTTQLQALRILTAIKKPVPIELAVAFLLPTQPTSPLHLLLHWAGSFGGDKAKIARQLETLAQCLLALTPSVSSKDDSTATENRLSISPSSALELQGAGLETRLHWWKLAGHSGDIDKDILSPLQKCLAAYLRRSNDEKSAAYSKLRAVFCRIRDLLPASLTPSASSKSPLASIYQTLLATAKDAGQLSEAISWANDLNDLMDRSTESAAKMCSVVAQRLALQLKDDISHSHNEKLLDEVLQGIQGPLRGDTSELDELLNSVCSLRRSAMGILLHQAKADKSKTGSTSMAEIRRQLETVITQFPKFCARWLGKAPVPKSSTKDFIRFEQRRQLLNNSIHHTLDSALMVVKMQLEGGRLSWEAMDNILRDILCLLEGMGEVGAADPSASYYVKISYFYFLQYNALRQLPNDSTDSGSLRALRRSVECMKNRPLEEKEKAQLVMKLERLADLCTASGRLEEAMGLLQSLRWTLLDEGVLKAVADAAHENGARRAWTMGGRVEILSRSLCALAKLEHVWIDWTTEYSELEQAAALEHYLHFILLSDGTKMKTLTLEERTVDKLLRIYIPTRYPIRRLRTLLTLLSHSIGVSETHATDIRSVTEDAVQIDENEDLGEDASLAPYLLHMRTYYMSMVSLADSLPDPEVAQRAISAWQGIVDSCQAKDQIESRIDDVQGLLKHLTSLEDLVRFKGLDILLLSVMELSARLTALIDDPKADGYIERHASLALQYVSLGQSAKAKSMLQRARDYVGDHGHQLACETLVTLYLSHADYSLATGSRNAAEENLALAQANFSPKTSGSKLQRRITFAYASFLQAIVAFDRGESHRALLQARESVRVVFQEWTRMESQVPTIHAARNAGTEDSTTPDISQVDQEDTQGARNLSSPEFWRLAHPLIRYMLRLSSIYAHLGMLQETVYYAEQAEKVARSMGSELYLAQCAAWTSAIWLKSAKPDKALASTEEAVSFVRSNQTSIIVSTMACQLSSVFRVAKDSQRELEMLERAETVMNIMKADITQESAQTVGNGNIVLKSKTTKVVIREKLTKPTRKTTKAVQPKRAIESTVAAKSARAATPVPSLVVEDPLTSNLRASIMVAKAFSSLSKKEWQNALTLLRDAEQLEKTPSAKSLVQIAMSASLIGQSMDLMVRDPVFSVVQDSTLSYPATATGTGADRSSTGTSPIQKARGATASQGAKITALPDYLEKLKQAQEHLLEAHSAAIVTGDRDQVHRISGMLQGVMLLITAASAKTKTVSHAGYAAISMELARNLTWKREQRALIVEKTSNKQDGNTWPAAISSPDTRRCSLEPMTDMNKFQRDYVDIIPKAWTAISISLSENRHDLCITKLQAGHSPFVLRLPLERATSRDADNDVFNFEQGHAELREIIQAANETCHDARDMTVKGAKSAWWADREALDTRLKGLLENIEHVWLGGFRGVFSQHPRFSDLLARFQKSFTIILDKHLPSRRRVRGRNGRAGTASVTRISLDPRILELFIGLGDATTVGCDFDEALTDLLYFVVDILQFHGERNAYDEIDFDSMVVDTFDALHAYHSAAKSVADSDANPHTILVLDKALHGFPWESLPCMQGLAISRVPSLACLRQLIQEQRARRPATPESGKEEVSGAFDALDGCHVSPSSGTYILNPSSDLASTQSTFSQPLSAQLPAAWRRIEARPPTEDEFERALTGSDVLLYFGHGSGAQYIRGRTIRRLEPRCRAAVLLMGCSSASLAEAGDFEVYGPVWNYMMAGCPAVVGTLWDVTDRDIDRFAGAVFEEWGLLRKGTFAEQEARAALVKGKGGGGGGKGRGKGKGKAVGGREDAHGSSGEAGTDASDRLTATSLVEAVSNARDACRFRYLTAGAVAVYGIPVYIDGPGRETPSE